MHSPAYLQEFLQSTRHSFYRIFVQESSERDIVDFIRIIERGDPMLDILKFNDVAFCRIFEPFNSDSVDPYDFKSISDQWILDPRLVDFFELSGKIESLCRHCADFQNEPPIEEKQFLCRHLKAFYKILPSPHEFEEWLGFTRGTP